MGSLHIDKIQTKTVDKPVCFGLLRILIQSPYRPEIVPIVLTKKKYRSF